MVGLGSDFWGNSIFIFPEQVFFMESEMLDINLKLIPLFLSFLGIFSSFYFYNFFFRDLYFLKTNFRGKHFYVFFNKKWFFDKIYNENFITRVLTFSYFISYKGLDRGFLEYLGSRGLFFQVYLFMKDITFFFLGFSFHILFLFFFFIFEFFFLFSKNFYLFEMFDFR